MKEIRTEIIESKTSVKVIYACDFPDCKFEAESSYDEAKHEAQHHVKKQKQIGEISFYYFETAENMKAWSEAQKRMHAHDFINGKFIIPGWYGAEARSSYYRGSEDYGIELILSGHFEDKWRDEIKELEEHLKELSDLT